MEDREERSLTMSYFHTRMRTIIGVESFHCPVRDEKGWIQLAMVVRQKILQDQTCRNLKEENLSGKEEGKSQALVATQCLLSLTISVPWKPPGYRVKPHGQLVLISFTHYCASTPSLSTS